MLKGFFLQSYPNIPVIQVILAFGQAVQQPFFILDTGFTGDLQVSPTVAKQLGLVPTAVEPVRIADGSVVNMQSALAYVSMEGMVNPVTVTISHGSHLAGIGLFTKFAYKASVDCKYRRVELERML